MPLVLNDTGVVLVTESTDIVVMINLLSVLVAVCKIKNEIYWEGTEDKSGG